MKIKIFKSVNSVCLENTINSFISKNSIDVKDIKYTTTKKENKFYSTTILFSAMIIYEEKKKKNSSKKEDMD